MLRATIDGHAAGIRQGGGDVGKIDRVRVSRNRRQGIRFWGLRE
jgi:hypothetical protein